MSYGNYRGPFNPKNPIPDGEARISIYNYTPALALGLIGAILFGLAAIGHFYFWWIGGKKRVARDGQGRPTRWFEALWTLGCVMEVVGYAFRTYSNKNPFYVNAFIIQYFFIVIVSRSRPFGGTSEFDRSIFHTGPRLFCCSGLPGVEVRYQPERRQFEDLTGQRKVCQGLYRNRHLHYDPPDRRCGLGETVCSSDSRSNHTKSSFLPSFVKIGVAESRRANQGDSPITSEQANDILLAGLAAQVS